MLNFANERNGKYIMFPPSFRQNNTRFSLKFILNENQNNNTRFKIINELQENDIILFKYQIFGMDDDYIHIGYDYSNSISRKTMNFYVIKAYKNYQQKVYVFENGNVRELEYEEFKNVIPSELIELVQEQHISSEIDNIDINGIEYEEKNGNQQKIQCQKCDEIEEMIFEMDGYNEDIDKKTIEAEKEQEIIRQKLFALKAKESSPSTKQNQGKRRLDNCKVDNNGAGNKKRKITDYFLF